MRVPHHGRGAAPALLALTAALALAACGSDSGGGGGSSGARTVEVSLTDAGCEPARLDLPAGATTFKVTNKGTGKVTEFEVKDGERILGEVENVTAGLERSFSLNLKPGTYTLECPGGSNDEGTLTVSAGAGGAGGRIQQRFDAAEAALTPYRQGPVGGYRSYDRLDDADKRRLSQSIDALAEPLSLVSAKLAAAAQEVSEQQ